MGAETANALVAVLRGTASDPFGDVADDMQTLVAGVSATLVETAQTVFDPDTGTPRIVRASYCTLPSWIGVLVSDQVQDQATGDIYSIQDIATPPTTIGAPVDTRLTLRRVSGGAP